MPKIIDHARRRTDLAAAAVQAIDELGLDTVRLVDIARIANCTTGAVSHYFADKNAVLEAALDYVIGRLSKLASEHEASDRAALLHSLANALPLDDPRRRDWRVWIAFCGRAVSSADLQAMHRDWYARLESMLCAKLSACLEVTPTQARSLATQIIATVDGIGIRATLEPQTWPPQRQIGQFREQIEPLLDHATATNTDPALHKRTGT